MYLKTGDQGDYESAERAGYGCFLRRDFLSILAVGETLGVTNTIFTDFHSHLQGIEKAVESFGGTPSSEWGRPQWMGFFTALRSELGDGEWAVRGHGGGGSLTFLWHRREDKYLRLHGDELAFCLEVTEEAQQEAKREAWSQRLLAQNRAGGIHILPARQKLGKRMTVAVLAGDYRQLTDRKGLDFTQTVEILKKAEQLMDAALAS